MQDNQAKQPNRIDLTPISSGTVGSPKAMYVYFLLALCRNYFENMKEGSNQSIDSSTAALIAFCPNKDIRDKLWNNYLKEKGGTNTVTASVHAVGDLITYLSEVLEFEQHSTGGLM